MTNICPTEHGNVQRFVRLSNGFQVFENDGDSLSVVCPFLAFTLGVDGFVFREESRCRVEEEHGVFFAECTSPGLDGLSWASI